LLVLPGAEPLGAQEDGAGAARVECFLQRLLPGFPRDEMPLVQERLDSRLSKLQGELFHGRLVRAAVAPGDVLERPHCMGRILPNPAWKPEIRLQKPEILRWKPQIPRQKPEIPAWKPQILRQKPQILA